MSQNARMVIIIKSDGEIWLHLYNLKHVKNIYREVLLLLKVTLSYGVFLIFYIVQMAPNHAKYRIIVEDPGWEGGGD